MLQLCVAGRTHVSSVFRVCLRRMCLGRIHPRRVSSYLVHRRDGVVHLVDAADLLLLHLETLRHRPRLDARQRHGQVRLVEPVHVILQCVDLALGGRAGGHDRLVDGGPGRKGERGGGREGRAAR